MKGDLARAGKLLSCSALKGSGICTQRAQQLCTKSSLTSASYSSQHIQFNKLQMPDSSQHK